VAPAAKARNGIVPTGRIRPVLAFNNIKPASRKSIKILGNKGNPKLSPLMQRSIRAHGNQKRAEKQGKAIKDFFSYAKSYTERDIKKRTGGRTLRQVTNSLNTSANAARIYSEQRKPKNNVRPVRRRR
jgi:hypothetical protein